MKGSTLVTDVSDARSIYAEKMAKIDAAVEKIKRKNRRRLIISIIFTVIGVLMMAYPVVATFQKNQALTDQINNYTNAIGQLGPVANEASLQDAREYNSWLSSHPFVPPPIGSEADDPNYNYYKSQLSSENDPMAQIVIPNVDINLPVYHGTSHETLTRGAGHLYGTHLPIGAESEGVTRTTAISAHTGMINASMFDNLRNMKEGDSAFIRVRGQDLHYVMRSSKIVEPTDMQAIHTEPGKDLLQLITCTPYSVNTKRLVVTMERAPMPSPAPNLDAAKNPYGPAGWQWWMSCTTGASILFVLLLVYTIISNRRRMRKVHALAQDKRSEIRRELLIGE